MWVNIWNVLNIQPTNDISAIKKAYAIKLRQCHPEDDPQGYQELREAYETAIKHAKSSNAKNSINKHINNESSNNDSINHDRSNNDNSNNDNSNNDNSNNDNNAIETQGNSANGFNGVNSNNEKKNLEQRFKEILTEAESIYNDFSLRIDLDCWRVFFNRDLFWDLVNKEKLSHRMIKFIASHRYYPKEIWELFDLNLNIQQNIETIKHSFPNKFVLYMLRRIKETDYLEYKNLNDLKLANLEDFIKYREKAFDEIKNREYEKAYKSIEKALEIYEHDPDLIRLHSEYYSLNYDSDRALIYLNDLLEKNPGDFASLIKRAKFLYDRKEYKSVIDDLKRALKVKQDIDAIIFLAQCYILTENFFEAKKVVLKAMETSFEDSRLRESLLEINKKIRGKLAYDLIDRPKDKALKAHIKQIDAEIYAHYQQDYKKIENFGPPDLSLVRRIFSKKNIITYIILLFVLLASIGLFKGSFYSNNFEVFNFIRFSIGVCIVMFLVIIVRK